MYPFRMRSYLLATRKPGATYLRMPTHTASHDAMLMAVRDLVDDASCWNVSNVAEYLGPLPLDAPKLDFSGFPCLPPFPVIWLEYKTADDPSSSAIMVSQSEEQTDLPTFNVFTFMWSSECQAPIFVPQMHRLEFAEDGTLHRHMAATQASTDGDQTSFCDEVLDRSVKVALASFLFSHCQNVSTEDHLPTRQRRREAERRGEPALRWTELVIDPNRERIRYSAEGVDRNANFPPARALHIARGHFAHYTEEKPLFGKLTGTFWRPTHVRGSAELGAVKSTYRVKVYPNRPLIRRILSLTS